MKEKEKIIKNPSEKLHPVKSCVAGILSKTKLFNKASIRNYEIVSTIISVFLVFVAFYFFFFSSPFNFPVGTIVHINEGASLNEISELLDQKNVIKSPFWFKVLVTVIGGEDKAKAGDYFFSKKRNAFTIASKIIKGEYGLTPISITIPEGATTFEMAEIFSKKINSFNSEKFLKLATPMEGYLFPDTYFFLPNVTPEQIIDAMKNNFIRKVGGIYNKIEKSGKSLEEIIIMASLLEEEARTLETRKIISGILWQRIEINMPLQVDAVFLYIIGKNTYELTLKDLSYDSPYNTYKYKGLPFGPISSPGINSIEAAISPIETDYLFYLSDRSGNMHYAETFEKHKINKFRYVY
ncbi:endolytic transglycosylase MltG [Patescibacteria group bacterium]|nr:endolytic transglycosylase MltG [Patescibacteria group bacterium]MBU4057429.1 endolytic transglycosylase MltG [Patescibacteria group bacterium]MBU4115678.1 endolytic transglycosylase MltG [Patescibacteria group bacterium]